jgi:nucleotide-binding universal stress UspA family protein
MKTILIPVEFTNTSDNALEYALAWCRDFEFNHIVLLKTFHSSIFENVLPTTEYINVSQEHRKNEMEMLQQRSQTFTDLLGPDVKVSVVVSEGPLLRTIIDTLESGKTDLIIMGSDHFSDAKNSFISSQIIEIAKTSPVNVLIVPSTCKYQAIKKILVPVNIQSIGFLERFEKHRVKSTKWLDKELMVLNIDPKEKYLLQDEAFGRNESSLHEYLKNFNHEIYYSNDKDILKGIFNFLNKHHADLVVALPGKHSFLYSLTHKSISEALYRDTPKPVLILK